MGYGHYSRPALVQISCDIDGQPGTVRATAEVVDPGNPLGIGVGIDDRLGSGVQIGQQFVEVVAERIESTTCGIASIRGEFGLVKHMPLQHKAARSVVRRVKITGCATTELRCARQRTQ